MAKHFISVLGTGLYEPVSYAWKDYQSEEQEFIQAALVEMYADELSKDGKISIFLTEGTRGARKRNWEDRTYEKNDVTQSGRWTSSAKEKITEGGEKKGLKYYIDELGLGGITEGISIEDASTESKIWSVFQAIYSAIAEGDEIIFDITHGFRSIPMLAITILNYARVMKNCRIGGIYYGAYEAARDHDGIAPIVDLTVYNDILQWTSATESFIQHGNADQIQSVYKEKKDSVPVEEKKEWSGLGKTIDTMKNLSDTIAACRGINGDRLNQKNKREVSIRCAYQAFKEQVECNEYPQQAAENIPLQELLKKAEESYSQLDKANDYEVGLEVVKLSIRNNNIQLGYTALEETVKTFFCDIYGIDNGSEENRDHLVGAMLNIFSHMNIKVKKEEQYMPEVRKKIEEEIKDNLYFVEIYENAKGDTKRLTLLDRMIETLPVQLAATAGKIKRERNDINHFGFNKQPLSAQRLKEQLRKNLEEIEQFLENDLEEFRNRISKSQSRRA